jgi:excisionase family DNA binding protein
MIGEYYSVEQISELLNIHPKTIQRYIREGKLRACKIGKSWRVTGHDLSVFTENSKENHEEQSMGSVKQRTDRVTASCVVDIGVDDRDEAIRIVNTLTAALNTKPAEYGRSTMHVQFLETEYKVRAALWGSTKFMTAMLGFISAFTDQFEEE